MRVRDLGAFVLCLLSSAGVRSQAPQDLPRFYAGVELIQLDVAVLDGKRQPVRGLRASDFTVLENGVARPIRAFAQVDLAPRPRAAEAVWADAVPPDVATNQVAEREGRLVVILLDRSIPVQQPEAAARRIAAAAVAALGPDDLAAVVSTGHGAIQNLTQDRARLLRAIDASDLSDGMSPEADAIVNGMGFSLDPLNDGRCLCGVCVLDTIRRVAEAVRDAPRRRKLLLFIGSRVTWQATATDTATGADVGCQFLLKEARRTMFEAVDRANLTVHSIDPQGLVGTGPQTRASVSGGGFDRPLGGGPAVRLRQQQSEMAGVLASQESLRVLPERTGGRTIVNRNNADETVPDIFRESEAYYVLGIEPANPVPPDGPRAIEVKVGRRDLHVAAQRQYVVSPPARTRTPGASQAPAVSPIETALARLLPSAGVPLASSVTVLANPDNARALVQVNLDARAFARADGTAGPLEVALVAVNRAGRAVASARQTSSVDAGRRPPGAADLNLQTHLELPPGDYELRAAVSDPVSGVAASVFSDVTVPLFGSAPLSLSGVSVEIGRGAAAPAPTTRRTFRRDDVVRGLLQIYQGTQRTDDTVPVSMHVQILDAQGRAVRDQSLPFTAAMFANRRADCVITIPVARLPAGEYVLRLEASTDRRTAGRALRFAVD